MIFENTIKKKTWCGLIYMSVLVTVFDNFSTYDYMIIIPMILNMMMRLTFSANTLH